MYAVKILAELQKNYPITHYEKLVVPSYGTNGYKKDGWMGKGIEN